MKWPLRNSGATYLRDVTDTVQTVQYSDSQCTVYTLTILARASMLKLVVCRALLYSTTTFYTVHVLLFMQTGMYQNGIRLRCYFFRMLSGSLCMETMTAQLMLKYHALSLI